MGYFPSTGSGSYDRSELPDGRKAPSLWLQMYCPACFIEVTVDVFRGVPTHKDCPERKGGHAPIMMPDRFNTFRHRGQIDAVEIR